MRCILCLFKRIFSTSHVPLYFILNMYCLYRDYVKSCLYFYLSVGFFIENKTHPIHASVTNMKHNWRPVYFLHVFLLKLTCLWHTCIHLNIWPRLDYGAISGDIIINVYLIYFFVFILYLNISLIFGKRPKVHLNKTVIHFYLNIEDII